MGTDDAHPEPETPGPTTPGVGTTDATDGVQGVPYDAGPELLE